MQALSPTSAGHCGFSTIGVPFSMAKFMIVY
jgi:hypothetical protein